MNVTWSVGIIKRKGKFEKGSMDVLTPLFHGNVKLQAEHQQDFQAQHLNLTILNSSLRNPLPALAELGTILEPPYKPLHRKWFLRKLGFNRA
ncbi:unnamed protein product [Sphagnum balticum]